MSTASRGQARSASSRDVRDPRDTGRPSRRTSRPGGRFAEPRIHPRDLGRRGIITPFARLARGHALSVIGEALFAIGLANTVFFSGDPNQSRWRVAGYLLLTFAPFLVAGPLIGPILDRAKGGRKWVMFGAALARAVLCLLLLRNLDDIYFYVEAFLMLVFSKVNLISKSALVPTTVNNDEELVEANSKLTSLGAMSAVAGAALAGIAIIVVKIPFLELDGTHAQTVAILFLGAIAFVGCATQAWNLPRTQVADHDADAIEKAELRSAGIVLAASATGFSRAVMGFLTFLLAFWVRNENHPFVWIGVLVAAAQVGYFIGSFVAPMARRAVPEERMIQLSLGAMSAAAFATYFLRDVGDGLGGAAILAFTVGITSNVIKQGFDSLVQRDAPDANRGRSFAKFETRFQLWWAVGALLPVVLPVPLWVGILSIAAVSAFALASYVFGLYEMTEIVAGRRQPKAKKDKPWNPAAIRARARRKAPDEESDDPTALATTAIQEVGFAGRPPATPAGPATASPTDPTAGAGGEALFGQRDTPMPEALAGPPEGGLFDPAAPPPPPAPGYRQPTDAEPRWAGTSTGSTEWAAVVPQVPESPGGTVNRGDSRAGSGKDIGEDQPCDELDIVELEDGTYAYRGTVADPGGDPPAPEAQDQWQDAEPHWRDEAEQDGRTTNELPAVRPRREV